MAIVFGAIALFAIVSALVMPIEVPQWEGNWGYHKREDYVERCYSEPQPAQSGWEVYY